MNVGANPLGANQNPGKPSGRLAGMDRGLWLSMQAIRRQLAAMPHSLFLVRLIHQATRRPFPGERLWTATQLLSPATLRFLRVRNREGCDVYIWPYAEDQNAGYILVDLDRAAPDVLETMWANGHEPCVVLQTSSGHFQAWIHVSTLPLQAAVATAIGKHLARLYGGDAASTDWRHLGRLAGFTNQKPQRRTVSGHAPWVKIVHARAGLARNADALLSALHTPALASQGFDDSVWERQLGLAEGRLPVAPYGIEAAEAVEIYQSWTRRWRIVERFTQPDWSIVDLWIARQLLSQGMLTGQVQDVLRLASPHFPRHHTDPDDYLRRTVAYACSFPAHAAACVNGPLKEHAMDCPPHG
jgi:hypothetical protein